MMIPDKALAIQTHSIEAKIVLFRGQRVMLDSDLAMLYGVQTKALVQAVKRNLTRFPTDFMFQLDTNEFEILRSQFVTSSWGGRRYPPFVFTEQGIAMLSTVLKSEKAIQVNIEIMRAFVKLRRVMLSHDEIARKVGELEKKINTQDGEIKVIFATINTMLNPVQKKKRQIGFPSKLG